MSKQRRVQLNIFGGESAHTNPAVGRCTERTVNWYPSAEGMLKTYMGGKRVLAAEDLTPSNPGNNGPIAWDDKYVRSGTFFTDVFGNRRLVVVVERTIYEVAGNDVHTIFTYPTGIDRDDDDSVVEIIVHQNFCIFLHPNFPPIKWGGEYGPSWLGVRDIPPSPEIHTNEPWSKYFETPDNWGMLTANYKPPVFLQHDDSIEQETRGWWYKAAYMNARGQIGRWGDRAWMELPSTGGDQTRRLHPIIEWQRPKDEGPDYQNAQQAGNPTGNGTDITHVVLARTGNTWTDPDAGAFFVQGVYPFTMNHVTDMVPDAGLALAIEEDNYPAPNASFGCVYRDTVFLSGNYEDPNGVWWCKPGFMESWPPLNYYKATSKVTNVVAMPDRVAVITENGIEVLREDSNGFYTLFRKESAKGSVLGKSFVEYKGSLFGVFDGGFGVFDGFAYKGMADEFGELFDFLSYANFDRIRAFVDTRGRYFLSANATDESGDDGLGYILMYDFTLNSWFRIEEHNATCFFEEEDELYLGGRDNFRIFDGGNAGGTHVLEFKITMERDNPQFAIIHKELMDMYVRIGSTGNYTATVSLYADEMNVEPVAQGEYSTLLGRPGLTDAKKDSVWDSAVLDDGAQWDAPRHGWQKVILDGPVEFYTLRVQISVPSQAHAEISGFLLDLEVEDVQTPM